MEREKYEKLKPLSKDEILDAMGKLSQEAAGHEAAEEGLKERRKDAKKQYDADPKGRHAEAYYNIVMVRGDAYAALGKQVEATADYTLALPIAEQLAADGKRKDIEADVVLMKAYLARTKR